MWTKVLCLLIIGQLCLAMPRTGVHVDLVKIARVVNGPVDYENKGVEKESIVEKVYGTCVTDCSAATTDTKEVNDAYETIIHLDKKP